MNAIRIAACAALLLSGPAAMAADACSAYKWDVSREVALYATPATPAAAATSLKEAPKIDVGVHYEIALQPQPSVQYEAPPSKKMLADGAFGGVLKFKVAKPGAYRIAIDSGFWLDVLHHEQVLPAEDFNGQRDCVGPHKIVVYELPDHTLTLQIASAATEKVQLTITPVAAPAP